MGLKKLKILSIDLNGGCGENGRPGDLRRLQKHPALQEIRLISNEENKLIPLYTGLSIAVEVPLTTSLCGFFATQQLKVLHLFFRKRVKVNIQRFLAILLLCCVLFAEGWDITMS